MKENQNTVDLFERDTHLWGLSSSMALWIAILPIILVLVMVAAVRLPDLYVWLTAEDSLLEWTQFILVFTASLLFAWSGVLLFKSHQRAMAVVFFLIALGTFFVAGEEIAWGQRIFGWSTPEALEAVNAQQETTLHKISTVHPLFVYGMMLAGLYGAIVPLVAAIWWKKRIGSLADRLLIPPLCLVPAFLIPFAYRFSRLALGVDERFPRLIFAITKFSEVTEVCFYFALMIFAWLNLRHIRAVIPSHAR